MAIGSDNSQSPPPHGPITPAGTGPNSTATPLIPMRHILIGLFFYPHSVFFLAQHRVHPGRALRVVVLLSLTCGMAIGLVKLPGTFSALEDWVAWFSSRVESMWIEDGRLEWTKPENTPWTTRHRGWRIDFVEEKSEFTPEALKGPERRGIWVSPSQAFAWWQQPGGAIAYLTLLHESKLGGIVNLNDLYPNGLRFEGDRFVGHPRSIMWQAVPVILFQNSLAVFVPVLTYTLVFSLVTLLLRGPLAANGFRGVLVFHLYASIPPLIVASIYSGLGVPYLDLSTVFVGAFVVYLFVIFSAVNRLAEQKNDQRPQR